VRQAAESLARMNYPGRLRVFRNKRGFLATAVLALAVALALPAASALAAPPPNDAYADATTLAFPDTDAEVTSDGTTVEATGQTGEPNPHGYARPSSGCPDAGGMTGGAPCERSVWYSMTATRNATIEARTCELSGDADTVIGVYTGDDLTRLDPVAENDDDFSACSAFPAASLVRFEARAGTTYHIVVAGFRSNETGFTLHVSAPSPQVPNVSRHFSGTVNPDRTPLEFEIDSEPDATVTCSIDGAAAQPCASVYTLPGAGLTEGHHTLTAFAHRDGLTSAESSPEDWTVDRTPPDTSISSGPADGDSADQSAVYQVQSTEDGSLDCVIDGVADVALDDCDSGVNVNADTDTPFHVAGLCNGPHTVGFRAEDFASNIDPTPATRSVTSTGGPDCAAPTLSDYHHDALASLAAGSIFVDGHGAGTTGHIEWGPTTAYGHSTPEQDIGTSGTLGDESNFDDLIPWLDPGTTVHLRFVAHNASGTTTSGDFQITTPAASGPAPTAGLDSPTDVTGTSATLHGVVHTEQPTYAAFEYGRTTDYGHYTTVAVFVNPGANLAMVGPVTGLDPGTTYHYRLLAGSAGGLARSADGTFTTSGGSGPQTQPVIQPQPQGPPQKLFDRSAPRLTAAGSSTAKLTSSGALSFLVRSDENATGSATGTISVPKGAKAYRFKKHSVKLRAGKRNKVTLKLAKKDAQRVRKALAHHKLKAKITLVVHDASANRSTKRITLKLKR
jgi:hypothetical protein